MLPAVRKLGLRAHVHSGPGVRGTPQKEGTPPLPNALGLGAARGGAGRRYSPKAPGRGGHVVRGPGDKKRAWERCAERQRWTRGEWVSAAAQAWTDGRADGH